MDKQELDRVEELAKAATPGPWGAYEGDYDATVFVDEHKDGERPNPYTRVATCDNENDAEDGYPLYCKDGAYIAAANPAFTLSLIAEIRRLQAENTRSQALPTLVEGEIGVTPADARPEAFHDKAERLIEAMEDCVKTRDGAYLSLDAIETLLTYIRASLPSLLVESKQQEWISVEDELPPTREREANVWMKWHESERVLAIEKGEKKAGLYWCNEKGQWRHCGSEFHGHYAQVTHWQPLPTPPTAPTVKGAQDEA